MKEGWFAPQALAWTFFGPISEVPAACLTMKKSDLHDDVQATSASGTELENPKRREPKMRERAQNENLLILSVPPYRVAQDLNRLTAVSEKR